MFATITHIPSLHKILSNTPRNHPAPPPTTPNIIRHKTLLQSSSGTELILSANNTNDPFNPGDNTVFGEDTFRVWQDEVARIKVVVSWLLALDSCAQTVSAHTMHMADLHEPLASMVQLRVTVCK
jgi:hypothetical protein